MSYKMHDFSVNEKFNKIIYLLTSSHVKHDNNWHTYLPFKLNMRHLFI